MPRYDFSVARTPLESTSAEEQEFTRIGAMPEGETWDYPGTEEGLRRTIKRWYWWRKRSKHLMMKVTNMAADKADPGCGIDAWITKELDGQPVLKFRRQAPLIRRE